MIVPKNQERALKKYWVLLTPQSTKLKILIQIFGRITMLG
jgi:hypothetical protein